MTSNRAVRPVTYGCWDWKARQHATNIIHGLTSSRDSAITWCGQHIVVRWDNWTEMPTTAVVTCVYCVVKAPAAL